MYSRERSLREDQTSLPQRRKTPSFSSSLLDSIYRSIDNNNNNDDQSTVAGVNYDDDYCEFSLYRETTTAAAMRKKQSIATFEVEEGDEHKHDVSSSSLRRAVMIEKWNEKQRMKKNSRALFNSASNSSDSSSSGGGGGGGGAFSSSSETDSSSYRARSTTTSCFTPIRSKHFRTRASTPLDDQSEKQLKHEGRGLGGGSGGFAKTKLRALKIYGDLKKSKDHPISPGRRIASFLNSLFNAKKEKLCSVEAMEEEEEAEDDTRSQKKSTKQCPSATSFSRSCLSKTPSSTSKLSLSDGGTKRSVRFYPVTVIVDEECRPCGQKTVYNDEDDDRRLMPIKKKLVSATPFLNKELTSKYGFEVRELCNNGGYGGDEDDEDDDDDVESYASSDLFELENIIGIGRYREELPVYETTNLKTNQAIAHGLIL